MSLCICWPTLGSLMVSLSLVSNDLLRTQDMIGESPFYWVRCQYREQIDVLKLSSDNEFLLKQGLKFHEIYISLAFLTKVIPVCIINAAPQMGSISKHAGGCYGPLVYQIQWNKGNEFIRSSGNATKAMNLEVMLYQVSCMAQFTL